MCPNDAPEEKEQNGQNDGAEGSAERELLAAIEGREEGAADPPKLQKTKIAQAAGKVDSMGNKLVFLIDNLKEGISSGAYEVSLQDVTKTLVWVMIFLAAWLVITFTKGFMSLENIPRFDVSSAKISSRAAAEKALPIADYTYYADVLLGRNIFKVVEKQAEAQAPAVPQINSLAENLKIAGLSWTPGQDDRSAMIEDTKTGITYFLREGDSISYFEIHKILKNSVILRYQDQEEIELR